MKKLNMSSITRRILASNITSMLVGFAMLSASGTALADAGAARLQYDYAPLSLHSETPRPTLSDAELERMQKQLDVDPSFIVPGAQVLPSDLDRLNDVPTVVDAWALEQITPEAIADHFIEEAVAPVVGEIGAGVLTGVFHSTEIGPMDEIDPRNPPPMFEPPPSAEEPLIIEQFSDDVPMNVELN